MEADQFDRIESLFHRAKLLDAADRAAFLDEKCDGDLELRSEVESLLAHADRGTEQMRLGAPPAAETIVDRGRLSERPGSRIGPYKILQQIGEGGFGVVYMAEQEEPVRRKVAVKIIKLGMDTKQVIARFEAERQALALMDHPSIARVLDAGATETGRPYFVMELVRGIPVTEYCDDRRLSTADRLALFREVCHAVQHAHQKGIIHRDIKPSNVLVTLHDDRPVPKVIDFGIAKATSQRLTEKTLFTEFRQFVGTPEYMSPDQAELSGLDVDTRTDIYSLGVVLYELLTGTTPFDPRTLRNSSYAEIQRIIKEEEPPKPSTRVGTLESSSPPLPSDVVADGDGESNADAIAWRRHTDAHGLRREMRGDLDWITMKAMDKDRSRRYQTANELADDVGRHLHDQPVLAGPPSTVYRVGKFARRHRVGVLTGGAIAAALVIGLSAATAGLLRARREASHSRAVSGFLQSLIIDVDGAGDGVPVDEVVDRGRELFGDDHAVVGTLLASRASALRGAGRLDEAVSAQTEALAFARQTHDGDHASVAAALTALGKLQEERGDLPGAEAMYTEALEMKERLFGAESHLTADALEDLVSMLVESADPTRFEEIRTLWRRAYDAYDAALGPEDRTTVRELSRMAAWLYNNGYVDDARPLLPLAVERGRTALAGDDFTYFLTLNAYGQMLILRDQQYAESRPVIDEMIAVSERIWGPDFQATISLRAQQVWLHSVAGDADAAWDAFVELVEWRRGRSEETQASLAMFAATQQAWMAVEDRVTAEQPALGRAFLLQAMGDARDVLGANTDQMLAVYREVGQYMIDHGFDEDAETLLAENIEMLRGAERVDRAAIAGRLVWLGTIRAKLGRPAEGEPALRECLELRRADLPADDWAIGSAESALGYCLTEQGRYDEAEPLLLAGYEAMRASSATPAVRLREARERL
ncbi:MAG: protein kinase domain-containing protein, partial [Planctomycetota bacterium]